jgi:hypothetical protein
MLEIKKEDYGSSHRALPIETIEVKRLNNMEAIA